MWRKISTFLFGLLFLVGLGILAYPTVADQWNNYRQNQLISNYEGTISKMEPEDFTKEWKKARKFNKSLEKNNLYGDVFGEAHQDLENTEYWKILDLAGDGVMGYLSIPKINVRLAIYHGTGEDLLQTGVGHLSGTKLPIGGKGTHCVLAAHRGLPSARLFGFHIYTVVSGSMEPAIPVGSLLYIQEAQPEDMEKEDVIAYYGGQDSTAIITHRVVENREVMGEFITKGDANAKEDKAPVPYSDFIGKVRLSIPKVGGAAQIFASTQGKIAAACSIGLAVILQVLGSVLESRRKAQE